MEQKKFFYHGKSINGYRFTIAGLFYSNINYPEDLSLGISLCSLSDNFVKKIGRDRSLGRAMSSSSKGRIINSLYSPDSFSLFMTGKGGFSEDWFINNELPPFLYFCEELENLSSAELKTYFNL